jgi:hypothetical protein
MYVLFFIEPKRWQVSLGGVSPYPTGEWVTQQARNLTMAIGNAPPRQSSWSAMAMPNSWGASTPSSHWAPGYPWRACRHRRCFLWFVTINQALADGSLDKVAGCDDNRIRTPTPQ